MRGCEFHREALETIRAFPETARKEAKRELKLGRRRLKELLNES